MRTYGNLYGDLSAGSGSNALTRDRGYAVKFLNNQDRAVRTDICAPGTRRRWWISCLKARADGSALECVPEDCPLECQEAAEAGRRLKSRSFCPKNQ